MVLHCLAFGPLLPWIYPIAAFAMLFTIFVSKLSLIKMDAAPPQVGTFLAKRFQIVVPIGLLLQVGLQLVVDQTLRAARFAGPNSGIGLPLGLNTAEVAVEVDTNEVTDVQNTTVFETYVRVHSAALLVLVLVYFNRGVESSLRKAFGCLCCIVPCVRTRKQVHGTTPFPYIKQPIKFAPRAHAPSLWRPHTLHNVPPSLQLQVPHQRWHPFHRGGPEARRHPRGHDERGGGRAGV